MKHIHCDLIKAWADGAHIQIFSTVKKVWEDINTTPHWYAECQYRIKPEYRKYRVSLNKGYPGIVTLTADNEEQAVSHEESLFFIKWLTDWIVYELEESPEAGSK